MGYSVKREHVLNNSDMLDAILTNVQKGITTRLELDEETGDVGYWQYKMHTILKSAEIYKDIQGGKYAGLRNLVSVKMVSESEIQIVPRIRAADENKLLISAARFTEKDLLEDLRTNPPARSLETRMYEFYPTEDFDPDTLITQAKALNWRLGPKFIQDEPDDPVSVAALDISSGEDFHEAKASQEKLMTQLGFRRAR